MAIWQDKKPSGLSGCWQKARWRLCMKDIRVFPKEDCETKLIKAS
jgi:hypothetical protein